MHRKPGAGSIGRVAWRDTPAAEGRCRPPPAGFSASPGGSFNNRKVFRESTWSRRRRTASSHVTAEEQRQLNAPQMTTRLIAGIDLGGTKIQTVVLNGEEIVGRFRIPTPQTGAEAVLAAMSES